MSISRNRKTLLTDMVRRHAQGVIENLELIWVFEEINDDEEAQFMQTELNAIAKRIGKSRTFASTDPDNCQVQP